MFRYQDRFQTSLRQVWDDPSRREDLLALLEQRDQDLEDWLVGRRTAGWAAVNGHATDLAAVCGSVNGGTNWGTGAVTSGRAGVDLSGWCTAQMRITAGGSSIAAGTAGTFRVNLPYRARWATGTADNLEIGSAEYLNAANTVFAQPTVVLVSATQAELYYPATHLGAITAVSTSAPFALASGTVLTLNVRYEVAP